jgi:uncharacterized protein (TIGR03083 family)
MTIRTTPAPDRRAASTVLAAEVGAFGALAARLGGDDWSRPTTSGAWTVRDLVAHSCGQFQELARFDVLLRRLREAKRRYPDRIALDGHNEVQIDDLRAVGDGELPARFARYGKAGARTVRWAPFFVRDVGAQRFFPESVPDGTRMSYILDVLAARDTWMHRVEIARATGHPLTLDAHDRAVVAQVMQELGAAWDGPPVAIELTGEAGGTFTIGDGEPTATLRADAIEMMLHLSGRPAAGIDRSSTLADARVIF